MAAEIAPGPILGGISWSKREWFVVVALTTIHGFKLTPMIPFIQSVRSREALNPWGKSPDFKSLANLVKSVVGTGLFAMPNAFASVGLVLGIIGTILMGLLVTVSLHVLLQIHHMACIRTRKPILQYNEVVAASLATGARKPWVSERFATVFVDATILICYVGVGSVYVVFISGTIQECFDKEKSIDQGYYALMLFPLFFIMNTIKYLNDIAIVSIVGNILLVIAASIGVIYAVKDGIGEEWVTISSDVTLYPKFIGTAFFSMSSPGIVLAIQHEMKNPWNYTKLDGVLNKGMIYVTLLHAFVGAMGYLKWGPNSLGNFMRNHPEHDLGTLIALAMQAFSIYFTYGLQCYMPVTIITEEYIVPALEDQTCKGSPFSWDLFVRLATSLITCLLAAAIPKLDLFIGLVGAVCTSTLSTIIPVALFIFVHHDNYGKLKWKLIGGVFLLTVASVIAVCAIVVDAILIVEFFRRRYAKNGRVA